MKTITVVTRNPEAIKIYLSFGAVEVDRGRSKFDDHIVIVESPDEHAEWNAMRLGSGMHAARVVDDLNEWKSEWGFHHPEEISQKIS